MRQGQSSLTAQGAALIRALEAKKPADQRVCSDPWHITLFIQFCEH